MLIQKIILGWKDTMCKNDDTYLKIPNKYNNLFKHKYALNTQITTFLEKTTFSPALALHQ